MIKMKYLNKGGNRNKATTRHLLSPKDDSGIKIRSHLIELLTKEIPCEYPNNPGCSNAYRLVSTD